ncbi:MAG: sugar ABC transporter substrate-binding protein [Blastocatellia bacterium]|nr:sugar ABC transporter substrate-binding protein [Blastocatellia bacterium]
MKRILIAALLLASLGGCFLKKGPKTVTIGVSFSDLKSDYAIAEFEAINAELRKREIKVLGAIADGDGDKQMAQVQNFITRRLTGIIVSPGRGASIPAMLRAAGDAGIPLVLLHQDAAPNGARMTAVLTDEVALARATVEQLFARSGASAGGRVKAAILLGDPRAPETAGRQQGFEEAVKGLGGKIAIAAQIASDGNTDTARDGLRNALKTHPDLNLLFVTSDSLLPTVAETLADAGRSQPIGEPRHLVLGSADGTPAAWRMLADRTLDAAGVPDLFFGSEAAVQALVDLLAGKSVPDKITDRGFVISPETLPQLGSRMWGSQIRR